MIVGLGDYASEWAAPYGYDANGNKIAPYGTDVFGRPRTGIPGEPGSNVGPDYTPEVLAEEAQVAASLVAAEAAHAAYMAKRSLTTTTPATAAAIKPATASIVNLTRPGSSYFQVGDRWQARVSGSENMQVCVTAKHPDGKSDTACYGSTDGSGLFTMAGTMDESTVGHWEETWHVGSADAPTFSFDVLKAQATQQTSGDSSGQQTTDKTPAPTSSSFGLSTLSTFISDNKWLLIGGAGVAVFMLMGRGK